MNYIDKIKKDGIVYQIKGIGSGSSSSASGGVGGNLNYEPDEEKGYQVLDTVYSVGQINTITYDGVVCHLLETNQTYNTAYYLSAFEPTTIVVPEESSGGEVEEGGGKKGATRGLSDAQPGDTIDCAQAVLIALIGGKFLVHQVITAASVPNDIVVDTGNRLLPEEDTLENKFYSYQDWFQANVMAYVERKYAAWREENGISSDDGGEEVGPIKGEAKGPIPIALPEIDESFEPTLEDLIYGATLQSNQNNNWTNFEIHTARDLFNIYTDSIESKILLTGLMPEYSDEEVGPGPELEM